MGFGCGAFFLVMDCDLDFSVSSAVFTGFATLSAQMTELMLPPEWVQRHDSKLSPPPKLAFALLLFCVGPVPTCIAALCRSAKAVS